MVANQEDSLLTPLQCRMARAGLRLGVRELGKLADVSPNTIARFERGENLHRRTVKAIYDALMQFDLVIETDGHGYEYIGAKPAE